MLRNMQAIQLEHEQTQAIKTNGRIKILIGYIKTPQHCTEGVWQPNTTKQHNQRYNKTTNAVTATQRRTCQTEWDNNVLPAASPTQCSCPQIPTQSVPLSALARTISQNATSCHSSLDVLARKYPPNAMSSPIHDECQCNNTYQMLITRASARAYWCLHA